MSVRVVPRREWGARYTIPGGRHVAPSARRWVVVHWPGSAVGGDARQVWRNIESFHRRQGWQAAPGYNFGVTRSGEILEGCGRDVRGIHSPPRNTDGFGVCVLISVGETPPQAALNATRALYEWLSSVSGRRLGMSWHGQHFATSCAGPNLNAWVQRGMPTTGGAPAPGPSPAPPGAPTQTPGTPRFPGRLLRFTPPNGFTRGEDVRTWQRGIRDQPPRGQGFWGLTIDGIYGPESQRAARDFQRREGLKVDGIVGPITWAATFRIPARGRPAGR